MRTLARLSLTLLFAGALFGQHHAGAPSGAGRAPSGVQHSAPSAGFSGGSPHLVGSGAPYRPAPSRPVPVVRSNGNFVGPRVYPTYYYGYPVYLGAGYVSGYASAYGDGSYATAPDAPPSYAADPSMTAHYAPSAEPYSPYQPTAQPDDQSTPDHYLIALTDHSIYSVVAYYVDGDTLHYFTAGNVHNQASLALVDRALTYRLNKESGLEVKLPELK
jgi:hypothetical protein